MSGSEEGPAGIDDGEAPWRRGPLATLAVLAVSFAPVVTTLVGLAPRGSPRPPPPPGGGARPRPPPRPGARPRRRAAHPPRPRPRHGHRGSRPAARARHA